MQSKKVAKRPCINHELHPSLKVAMSCLRFPACVRQAFKNSRRPFVCGAWSYLLTLTCASVGRQERKQYMSDCESDSTLFLFDHFMTRDILFSVYRHNILCHYLCYLNNSSAHRLNFLYIKKADSSYNKSAFSLENYFILTAQLLIYSFTHFTNIIRFTRLLPSDSKREK